MIRFTTKAFSFEFSTTGRALSLKRHPGGSQLLLPSDQPVFSVRMGAKTIALDLLASADGGSVLTATSEDDRIRAMFTVFERPGHLTFRLKDMQGAAGPLDLTMRLELAVKGMIGEVIACVHGGTDAVGLQGLSAYSSGCASAIKGGSEIRVTLHIRPNRSAAGVALFACDGNRALDSIEEIEVAEGLPHPVADGTWGKKSQATRLSYLAADFSPDEIEDAMGFAQRAGLKILYLPPWIWASGQGSATPGLGGWSATLGHFGVNTSAFPAGEKDLRGLSDRAAAKGIVIGAHTMSAWISAADSYVTPKPHPELAAWAEGVLEEDITAEANEIRIRGEGDFSRKEVLERGDWFSFQTVRISEELLVYEGEVEGRGPFVLRGCRRGSQGTRATAHRRGEKASFLIQGHGHFVPDPESRLLQEQAAQLADVMNACRLGIMSFDGLEASSFCGEWGMNLFVEAVFRRWNHHVICDASQQKHYLWHMLSRGNWGENMIGLRDEVERRGRLDNIAFQRRNLMPPALGWWPLRTRTLDYEATNTDDFEYILAKCAGYDASFCIESSIKVMKKHPQTGLILDLVRKWEGLRHSGILTDDQKALLRTNGLDFRFDDSRSPWRITPVKTDKALFAIAPGADERLQVPVVNPYHAQPVRFTIKVLAGIDRAAEGSISLLPATKDAMRPGPQAGTLSVEPAESRTGAPAYRFTCDYTRRFEQIVPQTYGQKVHDTESSPPVRYHWPGTAFCELPALREIPALQEVPVYKSPPPPQEPAGWPEGPTHPARGEWDLSKRRSLGMWLDAGPGSPGAMLFVEIVDAAGRVRQYYAPLDQPGRRWMEWPNGEACADRFYDYEWARGPDCSIWHALKEFNYTRIAMVRIGMVRLSPGTVAAAVVEGLRAMPEKTSILSRPAFLLGGRTLKVDGEIESDKFLAYEGGRHCGVFDSDWGKVGEVPVIGDLLVPNGSSRVEFASEGDGLKPWLGIQMRVIGEGFEVSDPTSSWGRNPSWGPNPER